MDAKFMAGRTSQEVRELKSLRTFSMGIVTPSRTSQEVRELKYRPEKGQRHLAHVAPRKRGMGCISTYQSAAAVSRRRTLQEIQEEGWSAFKRFFVKCRGAPLKQAES